MKLDPALIAELRQWLSRPEGGIVGFVDKLLTLCGNHQLQIDWSAGHLRLRSKEGPWIEMSDDLARKSVFRAILARIGFLARDLDSRSVSPYGGEGFITMNSMPLQRMIHVKFANTPAEQCLAIESVDAVAGELPSLKAGSVDG